MSLKPSIWFALLIAVAIIWLLTVCRVLGGQTSAFQSNAKPMAKPADMLPALPTDVPVYEEPNPATTMVRFGWDDTNAVASVGYWLMWGTNGLHSYSSSNRCSTTSGTLELPYGDAPPRWHLAVAAVGPNGLISKPSTELHIPEFPPNHVVLSWPTNSARLEHATAALGPWNSFTNVSGTNLDLPLQPQMGGHFYRGTPGLSIRTYFKEP